MDCWTDSSKQVHITANPPYPKCETSAACVPLPPQNCRPVSSCSVCNANETCAPNGIQCCTGPCSPVSNDCVAPGEPGYHTCPVASCTNAECDKTQPTVDNCGGVDCVLPSSINCGGGGGGGGGNPTPTPTPPLCTIQGRKVIYSGPSDPNALCTRGGWSYPYDEECEPAINRIVHNGSATNANNPYGFYDLPRASLQTVSADQLVSYSTGYTLCYNDLSCHQGAIVPGNIVGISCPAVPMSGQNNAIVDLYWHYTPVMGTINAKAVQIPNGTVACPAGYSSASFVDGAQIKLTRMSDVRTYTPPVPTPTYIMTYYSYYPTEDETKTQIGNTFKSWPNVVKSMTPPNDTSHVLSAISSGDPNLEAASICWDDGTTTPGHTIPADLSIDAYVGFTGPGPWFQTKDGDVYAKGSIMSKLPYNIPAPRIFARDGVGGFPGVVIYGTENAAPNNYDFSFENGIGDTPQGRFLVSGEGTGDEDWLANDVYATGTDFFSTYWTRLGAPTTESPQGNKSALTKGGLNCAAGVVPCIRYYKGPVTTSTAWNVGSAEKIIILVDDNTPGDASITIGNNTNVADGGFIAFITRGDINISSNTGVQENSVSPVVHGVYIANGTFKTGASTSVGKAKLVAKGMFIADDFTLERDLEDIGADNINNPAHIFEYNPQFLVTMPKEMMTTSYTWQEVAP